MPFEQIVLSALTLLLASIVQATIGFGAGMVAIPLLVLCGVPAQQAMGLILPNNIVQTSLNCWQHRDSWPRQDVLSVFGYRVAGLILGIAVLAGFVHDQLFARQVTGGALLTALGINYFIPIAPRARVPRIWTIGAGLCSGFLAGVVMMGGPPLVLWVMAHQWSTAHQRSFLWSQFLLLMPVHAAILTWRFGGPVWEALGYGCLLAPVAWVGAHCGAWLGRRLSAERLRWGMTVMLVVIGATAILAPWL